MSCLVQSSIVFCSPVLSCLVMSCLASSSLVLVGSLVLPWLVFSCLFWSQFYAVLSCPVLSCLVLSCLEIAFCLSWLTRGCCFPLSHIVSHIVLSRLIIFFVISPRIDGVGNDSGYMHMTRDNIYRVLSQWCVLLSLYSCHSLIYLVSSLVVVLPRGFGQ